MVLLSSTSINFHSNPCDACSSATDAQLDVKSPMTTPKMSPPKEESVRETGVFIDPGLMNELEFNIFIKQFIKNKADLLLIIKHIINSYNTSLIGALNQIMFDKRFAPAGGGNETGAKGGQDDSYNVAYKKIKSLIPYLQKHVLYKSDVLKLSYIFSERALSVFGEPLSTNGSVITNSKKGRSVVRFTLSNWIKLNPELFETEILMFNFFFNTCGNYIKKNVSSYLLENFFQETSEPVYIITTQDKMRMLNSIIINYDSLRFI